MSKGLTCLSDGLTVRRRREPRASGWSALRTALRMQAPAGRAGGDTTRGTHVTFSVPRLRKVIERNR